MSVSKVENKELPKIPICIVYNKALTTTGTTVVWAAGQHPKMTLIGGHIQTLVSV